MKLIEPKTRNVTPQKGKTQSELKLALSQRMFQARLQLSEHLGFIPTYGAIARMVAEVAELENPPDAAAVATWFRGTAPRTLSAMHAVAKVFRVDPGWLYFGYPKQDAESSKRAAA